MADSCRKKEVKQKGAPREKTIAGSYFVEYLSGGCIVLRPEKSPGFSHPITSEEFQMIMESAQNYKKGLVSDVIDLYEDDDLDD